MKVISRHFEKLESLGWASLDLSPRGTNTWMLGIAANLGQAVPLRKGEPILKHLHPQEANANPRNSLTARFGDGMFPPHTDTANWPTPARYVILGCLDPGSGSRTTTLVDWQTLAFSKKETSNLDASIFEVARRNGSFLTSPILCKSNQFIRIDFQCMRAKNWQAKAAEATVLEKFEKAPKVEIEWRPGKILILDNWKVLHARGSCKSPDFDRDLVRILVKA